LSAVALAKAEVRSRESGTWRGASLFGTESRGGEHGRQGLPPNLRLALDELGARRPDLAFDIRWFASLPSTMDAAASGAESGEPAGYVVLADEQTAGRGRRGHAWCSPAGAGLYFSYLARPARHIELVTLAAGVGVLEGVARSSGVRAHLKWPNDLLVGTHKLAGVLSEGSRIGAPDVSVVIGVGVNLEPAAYPPMVAARATNLRAEFGRAVDRFALLIAILEHLADALRTLDAGDAGDILRRWRAASPSAVGTAVRWKESGGNREGVTAGIDEEGALLVRTSAGIERIVGGELQWDS
jgi:BirA family biotin operon repressor/biotin-[acetyl-CoA-carboxylase] ligase